MVVRSKLVVRRRGRSGVVGGGGGDGFKQLARIIRDLPEDLHDEVETALNSAAMRGRSVVHEHIQNAKPYPAVHTGEMANSVTSYPIPGGARLAVEAPYAQFVEFGTRPFRPPLAPLAEWAMAKGIAQDEDEAMAIARGIAAKFEREGMEPRHFFKKAMRVILNDVVPAEVRRTLKGKHGY